MFIENLLVIASAFIVIVLLWFIVAMRYLRYLSREIKAQWEMIDQALRKRYDLIPSFIETVRVFTNAEEALIERTIKDRQATVKEYGNGADRMVVENYLSKDINDLINLGKKYTNLVADTNYLELRKEIDDLEQNMIDKNNRYNEMVRDYNRQREKVYMKPIAVIFGFKTINIFDVEK
jgi:LemA protein